MLQTKYFISTVVGPFEGPKKGFRKRNSICSKNTLRDLTLFKYGTIHPFFLAFCVLEDIVLLSRYQLYFLFNS